MSYVFSENRLGLPAIGATSTTKGCALGTIARAVDPTYGEGEFIYLLGVASTVVGSAVIYDATTYQTILVTGTAKQGASVAWAMSANLGTYYDWYQISGLVIAKKTAVAIGPQVPVYVSGTAGRVKVIASQGKAIVGCRSANLASVTTTTSTVILQVNRPALQGYVS